MRLALFILLLAGCSAYRVKDDGSASDRVFPDGIYRHAVTIRTNDGRSYGFNGVVKLAPRHIEVAGLSFLGTTVFRLTDDFSGSAPKVEIFVDALKKYEDRLVKVYALLKKLMLLPSKAEAKEVKLDEYDDHHIPRHVVIDGEKYHVEVKVTGYEI